LNKVYITAKEDYEEAVISSIRNSRIMSDKDLFWSIIDCLRDSVDFDRNDPVAFAIGEIVEAFEDFPSFIFSYGKLKNQLAKRLKDILPLDEYFTNMIDSLPLAGKNVCVRLLSGEATNVDLFEEILETCTKNCPEICDMILNKESFVEQKLEQVYMEKLTEILKRDYE